MNVDLEEPVDQPSRFIVAGELGIARRIRISLRQDLGKTIAHDAGDLAHEIGNLLPFVGQQILFQLGMDSPLGLHLRAFPTDEDAEQLHVPGGRLASVRLGWIAV